jgi:hypothetical protein
MLPSASAGVGNGRHLTCAGSLLPMAGKMYPILIHRFAAFIGAGTDLETQGGNPRILVVLAYGRLQGGHSPEMTRCRGGDGVQQSLANFTVSQSHFREHSSFVVITKYELVSALTEDVAGLNAMGLYRTKVRQRSLLARGNANKMRARRLTAWPAQQIVGLCACIRRRFC